MVLWPGLSLTGTTMVVEEAADELVTGTTITLLEPVPMGTVMVVEEALEVVVSCLTMELDELEDGL